MDNVYPVPPEKEFKKFLKEGNIMGREFAKAKKIKDKNIRLASKKRKLEENKKKRKERVKACKEIVLLMISGMFHVLFPVESENTRKGASNSLPG